MAAALSRATVACLICLIVVAAPAYAAPTFGINAGGVAAMPPASWDAFLASFRSSGLSSVRSDFSWGALEPQPAGANGARNFEWKQQDAWVAALARNGLRAYGLLCYSAPWAASSNGDPFSRPAEPGLYAGFAAAVADRYGRNGEFWREHPELPALPIERYEIWNEPNAQQFWQEQQTAPEEYARLYAASRTAIRRHDPSATVVVGGLVDGGMTGSSAAAFVRRMFSARPPLRRQVDAIGFHPYGARAQEVLAATKRFRRALDRLGARKVPLELTETGIWDHTLPEDARGRELARIVRGVRSSRLRISALLPFSAISDEADREDWVDWLGLWDRSGAPKAAGEILARAMREPAVGALATPRG